MPGAKRQQCFSATHANFDAPFAVGIIGIVKERVQTCKPKSHADDWKKKNVIPMQRVKRLSGQEENEARFYRTTHL